MFLYGYVASGHEVGWCKAWWYLLVQIVSGAYGVRGTMAVMFMTYGLRPALGVKRMRVVPIETLEVTDELSMLELPVPRSRRKTAAPRTARLSRPGASGQGGVGSARVDATNAISRSAGPRPRSTEAPPQAAVPR